MKFVMVVHCEGWSVLCSSTNKTQDMNHNDHISQVEPSNRQNSGVYILSSRLHLISVFVSYDTHRQHPELSQHHLRCTKQRLLVQHTPDNLHNSVLSLWASFHYMKLHHNANASDVGSFSTHIDGATGYPQTQGEGKGTDANICYESTPVVGS